MKNDNHPRWQAGYLLRKYSFPPGVILFFAKKRKRRNGKREESLPKNVFFYSFRVLILFVVRFLLKVARDSSNLEEMLCGLWVLSTSVCGTGSFSAHTVTHSISENGARGSGNL